MRKILYYTLSTLVLILSFTLLYHLHVEENREYLTVAFLNVGQGDSIFIEAPNGNQVIVDGGESSVVVRKLSEILPFYDRNIDMLIATHSDADHVGGFPDLFRRYGIKAYASNARKDDGGLSSEIENLSEKEESDRIYLNAGDIVVLDDENEVYIEILWPPKDYEYDDKNTSSVVGKLIYGETAFLLTGDIGHNEEHEILNMDIDSDVLKLGHHGSKHSSSEDFILKVDPKYSIVSAGKDNRFGHPSPDVLDLLSKTKTEVLETSVLGSIIFKSDGNEVRLVD